MQTTIENNHIGHRQDEYQAIPTQVKGQYSLRQILGIWLAAGAPMWILGLVVYPLFSHNLSVEDASLLRIKLLTVGLIWEFVLSMVLLYREEGNLRIQTIRRRFWLNNPISPRTGQKNNRLWWLLIPFTLLVIALELAIAPFIDDVFTKLFPFLAQPTGYSMEILFTPELKAHWIGAWNLLLLFVVLSVFNTFLGEEFLFRGLLLPKMNGVFKKWDWIANGVVFGLYHLHQPWDLPGDILTGLLFAFTGKRYHSNWFPIILHSGQSLFFTFLILGLILGWAR